MVVDNYSTCRLCGEVFNGKVWRRHFREECGGRDRILDNLDEYRERRGSYRGEENG